MAAEHPTPEEPDQRCPRLHEARATLILLYRVTEVVSPRHPAPPGWIASLHTALGVCSFDGQLDHFRLDDTFSVDVAWLHSHIAQVLRAFDALTPVSTDRTTAAGGVTSARAVNVSVEPHVDQAQTSH